MLVNAKKLVLGTAQFGADYGITNRHGKIKRKEVFSILSLAWDSGVRRFDTAPSYGSEELLGEFIRTHGIRDEAIVLTKIPKIDFQKRYTDEVKNSINRSTNNIGCMINTLFFHNPDDSLLLLKDPYYFNNIVIDGLTEKFGVSVYDPTEITRLQKSSLALAFQYPFNVIDHRFKNIELPKGQEYIRSIFLQGLLASRNPPRQGSASYLTEFHMQYRAVLERSRIEPYYFAFGFVFLKKRQSSLVIGVESLSQLQEILNTELDKDMLQKVGQEIKQLVFDSRVRDPRKWNKNP